MELNTLKKSLDQYFRVDDFSPDQPFSRVLPSVYQEVNYDWKRFFEPAYLKKFNGLMLSNSETVNKVFLVVFLNTEVLDAIFRTGETEIMIFTHHPLENETGKRGFIPLGESYFKQLRSRKISIYALHSPLDIHEEISTSKSIFRTLDLVNPEQFDQHMGGYAGLVGEFNTPQPFREFIKKVKRLFEVDKVNYVKKNNTVQRVGVIAGGGSDIVSIKGAIKKRCDTYLTGEYINRIENDYGSQSRQAFNSFLPTLTSMSLIECSHYATEMLVLKREMKEYFEKQKIPVEFIAQADPWY
jgi:putative NIF3 family GTP cyclohydrolase 1 type 2